MSGCRTGLVEGHCGAVRNGPEVNFENGPECVFGADGAIVTPSAPNASLLSSKRRLSNARGHIREFGMTRKGQIDMNSRGTRMRASLWQLRDLFGAYPVWASGESSFVPCGRSRASLAARPAVRGVARRQGYGVVLPLVRSVVVCLGVVLAGSGLCSVVALGDKSVTSGVGGSSAESSLLVVGAPLMLNGEGVRQAEETRRANPVVVLEREASRTRYEGLGAGEASKLVGEVFPGVVDHPVGGLPQLSEGEHVTSIIDANAARVSTVQGGHALLESVGPIATRSSSGKWTPIDLGVSEVSGAFRVANPAVAVSIPKQLQDGVRLAGMGVSLTPVDASGAAARRQ